MKAEIFSTEKPAQGSEISFRGCP